MYRQTDSEVREGILAYARNGAAIMVYGRGQAESITCRPTSSAERAIIRGSLIPLLERAAQGYQDRIDDVTGMLRHFPNYSFDGESGAEIIRDVRELLEKTERELRLARTMC